MTRAPSGALERAGRVLGRTVLVAGVAVMALSGCACERPLRPPRIGREVPTVRVKLGDDVPSAVVAVEGPWVLVAAEGEIASGDRLDWTPVSAAGGQVSVGSIATVDGAAELRARDGGPVAVGQEVRGATRRRRYRGTVRLQPVGATALRLINVLPMEAYLAGVLSRELLRAWHLEAYNAQAVAARTYALRARNLRSRYDFDLYDSVLSQVYGGIEAETEKAWQAVQATWGVVAIYRDAAGKPTLLPAYYHSTCGGDTVPAGSVFGGATPPPLVGGTRCTYCRNSPKYEWAEVVLTKAQVAEALRRSGAAALAGLGAVDRVEVASRTAAGQRADKVRVVGASGQSVLVRASDWRVLMGASKVPSTWFEIEDRGDRIALVHGRGYGHGVGLCQWGAQFLAEHGMTGEEILRYYYPGVELVRAY